MRERFFAVTELCKRFGGLEAVRRVSFEIQPHEIVGLIGPNGAGKTTLVRLIMGLIRPDAGRVVVRGEDITSHPTWKRVVQGITGTFQKSRPMKRLPLIANVMVGLYNPRVARQGEWVKTVQARALDALEFVGLSDLALSPAADLSQGDLKRLEIARAIATGPDLLMLDEPFAGLSQSETRLLATSVHRLRKGGRFGRLHTEGCAMLIVEHKLSELMRIADRILVMHFGELLADGAPEEVVNDPRVVEVYTGQTVGDAPGEAP
ncbi:MAG: ABC transporter ATP-binding protein [Candidatus Bipolaricaulota bacterium]